MRETKAENGFTLIELLVVISIIGTLSTVTLTTLISARTKARDTKRISELSAIALAVESYRTEHGVYPATSYSNDLVDGGENNWSDQFRSQLAEYFPDGVPKEPGRNTFSNLYAFGLLNTPGTPCDGHYAVLGMLEKCDSTTGAACGLGRCIFVKVLDMR